MGTDETGNDGNPRRLRGRTTTKAVAVPIYQTVAYAFDSAEHAAALFNLEAEGFRYTRIQNPTTAVLERRVAALEGGLEAMCVSSGQAAVNYAVLNVTELGCNIVSVPQLYGTTHTLFAHILPSQGVTVRFAESDDPEAIAKLIDDKTRAVFCESVGNPAGNICDIEGLARVAHEHGVPLIVDNTVASPILLRPIEHGADIVVNFADEIPGRPWHHAGRRHRRQRKLRLEAARIALSGLQPAGPFVSRPGLHRAFRQSCVYRALPQRLSAHRRSGAFAAERIPVVAGN